MATTGGMSVTTSYGVLITLDDNSRRELCQYLFGRSDIERWQEREGCLPLSLRKFEFRGMGTTGGKLATTSKRVLISKDGSNGRGVCHNLLEVMISRKGKNGREVCHYLVGSFDFEANRSNVLGNRKVEK